MSKDKKRALINLKAVCKSLERQKESIDNVLYNITMDIKFMQDMIKVLEVPQVSELDI